MTTRVKWSRIVPLTRVAKKIVNPMRSEASTFLRPFSEPAEMIKADDIVAVRKSITSRTCGKTRQRGFDATLRVHRFVGRSPKKRKNKNHPDNPRRSQVEVFHNRNIQSKVVAAIVHRS